MKLIRFTCSESTYPLNVPVPAKKMIPQWYKDGETFYVEHSGHGQEPSPGLKTCIPFLDILTAGYFLITPFDIFVGKKEDGSLSIEWNAPETWQDFINQRPHASGATIPRPAGHLDGHFVWSNKWGWKTPRGYSTIVTHPFNRSDLPFTTMSGFMDSDKISVNGNVPFFLKEGFSGVIPAGTPYAQIIPVKRKAWKMIDSPENIDLVKKQNVKINGEKAYYKKRSWVRKDYS
jgi:hypothetical protein